MGSVNIDMQNWRLTDDPIAIGKLEKPPSSADGLSRGKEKELRYLGCELIQSGAILLKLPQPAAVTGQILFQRYYYQHSFVRHNLEHTVMGCLLLASKIEEAPKRCREVIFAYDRLKQIYNRRESSLPDKEYVPMALDRNYVNLKSLVIKYERRILKALGFVVHIEHPHKFLYAYLHALNLLECEEMLQKSLNYVNDGLRTDIFLRYRPETIACACIELAARNISEPVVLPGKPFAWFELFDVSKREIDPICQVLLDLYTVKEAPKLRHLSLYVEALYNALTAPKIEKMVANGKDEGENNKKVGEEKEISKRKEDEGRKSTDDRKKEDRRSADSRKKEDCRSIDDRKKADRRSADDRKKKDHRGTDDSRKKDRKRLDVSEISDYIKGRKRKRSERSRERNESIPKRHSR